MAQKFYPNVVHASEVVRAGLEFTLIDIIHEPVVNVSPGIAHAIVRDDKTEDDIGIVFPPENSTICGSASNTPIKYIFWRPLNVTRVSASYPPN